MLNSKLKLKGYSLEEVIHEGVFGNIQELNIDDWKYLESLVEGYLTPEQVNEDISSQLDEAAEVNYSQGLDDGSRKYYYQMKRLEELLKENGIEY